MSFISNQVRALGCARRFFISLIAVVASQACWAQATNAELNVIRGQAEVIQRQEQERLKKDQEDARKRSGPVDGFDTDSLKPKIEVSPIGAPCRQITELVITDAPHLPQSMRDRANQEFVGRCLNVTDIERLLAEITKTYIDMGYIAARAYLPPQDLSRGRLEVLVLEGKIEKIVIEDGGKNSVSIFNTLPGLEGRLLNLRDLEQGLDQINRLASNSAKLDIQPGSVPGASTVVIKNQPQFPLHANVSLDNQGSATTGKRQLGLSMTADDLLGFNEMITLTHRESVPNPREKKSSESDSFAMSLPFGYTTLSLGVSNAVYSTILTLPSTLQFRFNGRSKTENVRIDHVVYRNQVTRFSVSGNLTTKDSESFFNNEALSVSTRKLTVLDLDTSLTTSLGGGVLTFDLGYASGLTLLGALRDQPNLPSDAPHAQFKKIKFGYNFVLPLDDGLTFSSQLVGQRALTTLFGSEQISIGSIYSVRGFVNNSLAGDSGFYMRNEMAYKKPFTFAGESMTGRFFTAFDVGTVRNRAPNIAQGTLKGLTIGGSITYKRATWELFHSESVSAPTGTALEPGQTWFRLSLSF